MAVDANTGMFSGVLTCFEMEQDDEYSSARKRL